MVLGLLGPAGLLHRSGSSCGTNSFVTWRAQRTRVLATKRSYVRTCRGALALTVAQNTVHGRVQHQVLVVFQPDILGHVLCPVFMQQGLRVKRRGETVVDESKQQRHPWKGKVRPRWTTLPVPPPRCLRTYHPSVVVGTGQFGEIGTTERAENNRYQKQ